MPDNDRIKAAFGDKVTIHYIGTLDNGVIFDARDAADPLIFTLGEGTVFPALEQRICGMTAGRTTNIGLPAEQAYGPRTRDNLIKVERSRFPADGGLEVRKLMTVTFADGEERLMRIIDLDDTLVTLDANHPLAGQDLTFALTLVAVEKC